MLIVGIIAISTSAIFAKLTTASPSALSMYRLWMACIFLLPVVVMKWKEWKNINGKDYAVLFFSGLFLGLHYLLWYGSLEYTSVASSTIILALQPLIALIGGFFLFKEKATKVTIVSMIVAIIGVVVIGWGDVSASDEALYGDFLSFCSVVAVVGYLLIGQKIISKLSHWVYSFIVFFVAGAVACLYNIVMDIPFVGYTQFDYLLFLATAIIPTMAAVIHNWLLNYVNATTISMSILGEPVGATVLAYFILQETLISSHLIGGVLVIIGVSFFLLQQQQPEKHIVSEQQKHV
ncbi:DMT family transporter [Priestia taiwanensis]|nr:DMT family transporter [Priestia taiwanensis]